VFIPRHPYPPYGAVMHLLGEQVALSLLFFNVLSVIPSVCEQVFRFDSAALIAEMTA
jgi:hypothetical protein